MPNYFKSGRIENGVGKDLNKVRGRAGIQQANQVKVELWLIN
jgi:hypothetical protein